MSDITPIFIVGCPRSGTTLLRRMIDSHPNISCGPETGFLADLERAERLNWERIVRFGVSRRQWHQQAADYFEWLHLQYMHAQGKRRWADKTPSYALFLDYIDQLFPTAQVVHIIRDGRDVVASHRDRWGIRSANRAVRAWPLHVGKARAWGQGQPGSRYYELRYEALVAEPEAVLRPLVAWLGEPWDDRVMAFGEFEHARGPNLSGPTPGAANRSDVYRSSVGAGSRRRRDLPQRLALEVTAGGLLRDLGYT